jgi:hypothetical protein
MVLLGVAVLEAPELPDATALFVPVPLAVTDFEGVPLRVDEEVVLVLVVALALEVALPDALAVRDAGPEPRRLEPPPLEVGKFAS